MTILPVTPSTSLRALRVSGADARAFLQGQLSTDLDALTPAHAVLSSCNSAQGRVQAVLWLVERDDGIGLILPTSMADGVYAVTGSVADLIKSTTGYTLACAAGGYALAGSAAGVRVARLLAAAAGAVTVTGVSVSLRDQRQVVAAGGAYDTTGGAVGTFVGRRLAPDPGAFAVTGSTVGVIDARRLGADGASYSCVGMNADLLKAVAWPYGSVVRAKNIRVHRAGAMNLKVGKG